MIADERIYYRGHDAGAARAHELAGRGRGVALDRYRGRRDSLARRQGCGAAPRAARPDSAVHRAAQSALALAAAADPLAFDLRPRAVAQTGSRILWLLTRVAAGGEAAGETIDATLAAAWGVPRSVDVVRAALILSADHELNVSTFTARCVASAGGSPYGVVVAGLAALEGTSTAARRRASKRRGNSCAARATCARRSRSKLRRGEAIEGFGHPLYPQRRPTRRGAARDVAELKTAVFARDFAAAAKTVIGEAPTVDFALVAVARALRLPNGAALTLFAIGRTIGWIGHAIEQYEANAIIRPRAKYVGETPPA